MALCCMLLSAGCSGRPESRAVAVNPCGWKSVEEREVSFVNSDTVSLRELSVFAVTGGRCSAGCDSLPLEITVHTPDSLLFIERVVLPFGTDAAEGTVRQRTFRSHGVLRREGTYRFAVSHTSGTPVRGLRAVGIEITETEHGKR
ncbi:MAG: hypothetical protein KBB03_08090 [Tidjanibacter sp.]|nr:hypothetical protein [Tidjanibacter sp.]MBP7005387.1 hypothetical protein [Tidjanibacter sp.]MBS1323542.1 hypothetical protein [Rikenellaceae bacterium]MEE0055844.1 hypothetical protein [Alistipes inops]HJE08904.1 hypothetical protein [Tidjanibacter sp.]